MDTETPIARPTFLISAFVPPAIPNLFLGTDDIIAFVFGDLNKPFAKPNVDKNNTILTTLDSIFNVDNSISAIPIIKIPNIFNISFPILSDK